VVIGILVAIAAITVPAVVRVRESANRLHCANSLRQLALGVHHFHTARGILPPGQVGPYRRQENQPYYGWGKDSVGWSWLARILPFVEQNDLYHDGGVPFKTLANSGIAQRRIPVFLCPSDGAWNGGPRTDAGNLPGFAVGHTNYKGVSGSNWGEDKGEGKSLHTDWRNRGTNGSFDGLIEPDGSMWRSDIHRGVRLADITDGTSNTFLLGEDVPARNRWCSWPYANNAYGTCAIPPNVRRPGGGEYDPHDWHNTWSFRSSHPGGLQFAAADGSSHFISNRIDLNVYRALATIRGNEPILLPE
jgi:hypothetical protein